MDIETLLADAESMDNLIISCDLNGVRELIVSMLERECQSSKSKAHHYYIVGNGYSALVGGLAAHWSEEAVGRSVRFYKKAIYEDGFQDLSDDLKSRIYTNLGIELCRQGRILEGIQEINKGLVFFDNPIAYMAKGRYLLQFSHLLFDEGHSIHFQKEAYPILKYVYECRQALLDADQVATLERDVHIVDFVEWCDTNFSDVCKAHPHLSSLKGRGGRTKKEKQYVKWCLANQLFINDLNDISQEPVVGFDILNFPDVTQKINPLLTISESLVFSSAFSEIKQQYSYARFNYFDALTSRYASREISHYSESYLYLTNSLDYCLYRRDIEMLKASFRILYSCFDKLAVLLYKYLRVGGREHDIYFSKIWYKDKKKAKIREEFLELSNPFLLALFWLSREINSGEEAGHGYWMDSNAEKLSDIRNKMEHGGFRVVLDDLHRVGKRFDEDKAEYNLKRLLSKIEDLKAKISSEGDTDAKRRLGDELSGVEELISEKERLKGYPLIITDVELREQTLQLMKKVRYAIIYTSLAVHYEENKKIDDGSAMPMIVPTF